MGGTAQPERLGGTVERFNDEKGYGFIRPDDGGEMLVAHLTEIREQDGYRTLHDGQRVTFERAQGRRWLVARNIVAEPMPPPAVAPNWFTRRQGVDDYAPTPMNTPPAAKVETGRVLWFNPEKGFGFITPDVEGPAIFVHFSVIRGERFDTLAQGQRVRFTRTEGRHGPVASKVEALEPAAARRHVNPAAPELDL